MIEGQNEINQDMRELQELRSRLAIIKDKIRSRLTKETVVFIDMVESTKLKTGNKNNPDIWIYSIYRFYEIVSFFIELWNGKVVKFMGDAVMARFPGEDQISNAVHFIKGLSTIEENLREATDKKIQIKIAVDYGDAYLFTHDEKIQKEDDVIGPVSDRCSRISKDQEASTVVSCGEFVRVSRKSGLKWEKIREEQLKGIKGVTKIYRLKKPPEIILNIDLGLDSPFLKDLQLKTKP